jgi:hypothetical protein
VTGIFQPIDYIDVNPYTIGQLTTNMGEQSRAAIMADLFEQYSFESFSVKWTGQCSESINGGMYGYYDTDPVDDDATYYRTENMMQIAAEHKGKQALYSSTQTWEAPKSMLNKWFWCRQGGGTTVSSTDIRLSSGGHFTCFNMTNPSAIADGTPLGAFTVKYKVRFRRPVAQEMRFSAEFLQTASETKDGNDYEPFLMSNRVEPFSNMITPNIANGGTGFLINAGFTTPAPCFYGFSGTVTNSNGVGGTQLILQGVDVSAANIINNFSVVSSTGVWAFSITVFMPCNQPAGTAILNVKHQTLATANTTYNVWFYREIYSPGDWTALPPNLFHTHSWSQKNERL